MENISLLPVKKHLTGSVDLLYLYSLGLMYLVKIGEDQSQHSYTLRRPFMYL